MNTCYRSDTAAVEMEDGAVWLNDQQGEKVQIILPNKGYITKLGIHYQIRDTLPNKGYITK